MTLLTIVATAEVDVEQRRWRALPQRTGRDEGALLSGPKSGQVRDRLVTAHVVANSVMYLRLPAAGSTPRVYLPVNGRVHERRLRKAASPE